MDDNRAFKDLNIKESTKVHDTKKFNFISETSNELFKMKIERFPEIFSSSTREFYLQNLLHSLEK